MASLALPPELNSKRIYIIICYSTSNIFVPYILNIMYVYIKHYINSQT